MEAFYDFIHASNSYMTSRGWNRLEETLFAATFSGVVSELVVESVSLQSATLIANKYHNGRPDLLPRGLYENDSVLRGAEGIEVKASRNASGWQGHNVESGWIMVFQYEVDTQTQPVEQRTPTRFVRVLCAQLTENDWSFSGRSANSRRTITASVLRPGYEKLVARPVYQDPTYERPARRLTRTRRR